MQYCNMPSIVGSANGTFPETLTPFRKILTPFWKILTPFPETALVFRATFVNSMRWEYEKMVKSLAICGKKVTFAVKTQN